MATGSGEPLDCTGCGNCADVCPAPGKALIMRPADEQIAKEADNWECDDHRPIPVHRLADLKAPVPSALFEFNGACPGCGKLTAPSPSFSANV